jgi:death-on-curing protein
MAEKATALCFALIQGHPFVDGNKRAGHAAMETFLILSGAEIEASVEDQERLILAGRMGLSQLTDWLRQHLKSLA